MSIYFLPTELLQLIFRIVRDDALAVNEEDMSWMSLAGVCKAWGGILDGDPFLWTRLAFNERTPFDVIKNALKKSKQVDVDLKFSAGSSLPEHGCHWVWMLAVGWGHVPYVFPANVRFLSFQWHRDVREDVFKSVECVQADGLVSLVLEEYEDSDSDDDGVLSDSSSAYGDLSGNEAEAEPEFELEPEGESADDEDDFDTDDEGASSDENIDSEDMDSEGTNSESTDSEGTDSVVDGNWDGSESDHASSEDESSDVSTPDATFGLGNDSSTYFDSESDGVKGLSELDADDDDDSTDADTEDDDDDDDDDDDSEDLDEDASDVEETGTDVSGPAEAEDDGDDAVEVVTHPRPASSPRVLVLELPILPSLINLTASSVLLSIPLDVKNKLIDMTLMNTSWYAGEYEDAGIAQSSTLDALEGCERLERLRLSNVLAIEGHDPEERTVALPNLKFLHLEDREEGVQDTLRYIRTTPELLTHIQLHTLFSSYKNWNSTLDGVFVGNLPADLPTPYFADTVSLGLQFNHKRITLQGTMWAAARDSEVSGPHKWELGAICSDSWSPGERNCLLPDAILELSHPRIVVGTNIVELAVHIAPGFVRVFGIDWSGLIFGLPNVRKFALGSDDAVGAFLATVVPDRRLSHWLDLVEVHFCLASLRTNVGSNIKELCCQFWCGVNALRSDSKVYLRLPGVYELNGTAPGWLAECLEYSRPEELTRSLTVHGRLRIVRDRCGTCHQPWEYVDAVYA